MRGLSSSLVASLVLAATNPASAQRSDPDRIREMLARMDANKDGQIVQDEVPEPQRARFVQMLKFADANQNGKLDRGEMQTILERARIQLNDQGEPDVGAGCPRADGAFRRQERAYLRAQCRCARR